MNSTAFVACTGAACYATATPWYYTSAPSVVPGMSDHALSLAAPVVAYWALSLLFHAFDISGWQWLDKYRIHTSEEVATRNMVSRRRVLGMVLFQQALQSALGWWWIDEDKMHAGPAEHWANARALIPAVRRSLSVVVGAEGAAENEAAVAYYVYWWAIPVAQIVLAMFVIDTWQYFIHRAMHVNKFLYRHLHSVHHQLYVPYAYGALYNHPLEGFFLDSLGAVLAESAACMTVRQAAFLFTISTLKTVDDHCGYQLPFDVLQWFSANTADYHDIHHQQIGIKHNFSQPFWVHWDSLLGTRMTREDIRRRRAARTKAQ